MRQLTEMVWLADTVLVAVPDMGHRQTDRQGAPTGHEQLSPPLFVLSCRSILFIYLLLLSLNIIYLFPLAGP